MEHAGHACKQFMTEDEVDVFCERYGMGDDRREDVGDTNEIKKADVRVCKLM